MRAGRRALAAGQPNRTGITIVRGEGSWVWDVSGRRYLDLVSGMATLNLGHAHPRVVAAAEQQMRTLVHTGGAFLDQAVPAYAERVARIAPQGLETVLFGVTGTGANELALGMARAATGRERVVSFHGSSDEAVAVAPFPRVERPGEHPDDLADDALAGLDRLHDTTAAPGEVAVYLVEPVQGVAGCFPAGERFLRGLRERADAHGILLIFDEVQTGIGRTGAWFGAQRYGVVPDALTSAKALGAGFPISALVARRELLDALPSAGGATFGAGPVACAAGAAGIEAIEREGLLHRVRETGEAVRARLDALAERHSSLRRARGLGYMLGLSCRDEEAADTIARGCIERRVLVIRSGVRGDVVRLIPPLNLGDEEWSVGLGALEDAVAAVG